MINFKVDPEKKKQIEEIARLKGYKSASEFIREAIDDKMNLQAVIDNFLEKNPPIDLEKVKIPDYIPDGTYLGIARNEIVIMGNTMDEVINKLSLKFPESATMILKKGEPVESFETLFSLFSSENTKCFHQIEIDRNFYPLLQLRVEIDG
ncbi:MAG: ribbon-helix-helix protein, CopG family [Candidatus Lokiarchaeota archaeon]|nr:ribbon-helix-helix protein, CopG family [Candidatus Lokiarchaeota archaeon]